MHTCYYYVTGVKHDIKVVKFLDKADNKRWLIILTWSTLTDISYTCMGLDRSWHWNSFLTLKSENKTHVACSTSWSNAAINLSQWSLLSGTMLRTYRWASITSSEPLLSITQPPILETHTLCVCCKFVCCFGAELLGIPLALAIYPSNQSHTCTHTHAWGWGNTELLLL